MKIISKYFVGCIAIVLLFSSCKEKTQFDVLTDVKGNYFSVKQYVLDEWESHIGEPVVFKKTIKENGKTDTSMTNADILDWPEVLEPFLATDISDRKYLNKYTFSQFDDELDNTHDFMYVANKSDMFVQKLLLTMDVNTMKVRGLYIETYKKTFLGETRQKLLYTPMRSIQIHELTDPLIGSKKDKMTQYDAIR